MTPPDRPPGLRGHVPALDGVRGLAILLVLVLHFGEVFGERVGVPITGRSACGAILGVAKAGWCGVDLFFVLSGFLITGILYDAKGTDRYFVSFYGRRAVRIFPLYYGVLAAVFVVAPVLGRGAGIDRELGPEQAWFWLYGVNVLAALKGQTFPLVHFWTLAVEEHFYLVWPLIVRAARREALMAVCVAVSAASLGLRTYLTARSINPLAAYMLTPCRVDTLTAGALLALAVRGPRGIDAVRPFAVAAVPAAGLALAAGLWFRGPGPVTPWAQTAGYTLLAVFFAGLVALALPDPSVSRVARAFGARGLRALGKYSYGIYVYHVFVMGALGRTLPPQRLAAAVGSTAAACVVFLAAGVALSFAVAWVSWWVYERPFLSLKERFFRYG